MRKGTLLVEKKGYRFKGDRKVLVYRMKQLKEGLKILGVSNLLRGKVAVKINIGGGVNGAPPTYTDLVLLKSLLEILLDAGAEPFVCEADMRTIEMDERRLILRGVLPILKELKIEFVNLSKTEVVWVKSFDGLLLPMPKILLEVKTISLPAPKSHWECGVTLSQKNMYGAIAERRKDKYHRDRRIDKWIAAAARIVNPELSIVGGRWFGGGLAPHFCVPVRLGYVFIAKDMVCCDAAFCDLIGYPQELVTHLMLNSGFKKVNYSLHEKSHNALLYK